MNWTVTYSRTFNGDDLYVGGFTDTTTGVTAVLYRSNIIEYHVRKFAPTGVALGEIILPTTTVAYTAFTMDPAGDFAAAGIVAGGSGQDMAVDVFDAAGVPLWSNTYDSGFDDTTNAVAMDTAGNVFVAGTFQNLVAGNTDAELAVFDNTGSFQWADSFDNGGGDDGLAVAVDAAGNSLFAGQTLEPSGPTDVAFLRKFDPAGVVQFSRTYSGSAWGTFGVEAARAVAPNPWDGNIYLAADGYFSMDIFRLDPLTGDVLTTGSTTAGATYQIVGGMAVDAGGNVVVSALGGNGSNYDFLVRQFDATLTPGWSKSYNQGVFDTFNFLNQTTKYAAASAAIGFSGSVFVTSSLTQNNSCFAQGDFLVRSTSAAGTTTWTVAFDGRSELDTTGVEVDAAGNAYVGGTSTFDAMLLKFAGGTGALSWARLPSLTGGSCVYDVQGLAAVGATEYLSVQAQELVTNLHTARVLTYDPAGVAGPTYIFDLIPEAFDGPVAADAAGNVFMAGYFTSSTTMEDDLFVVKWDPDGTVAWTLTYNGAGNDAPGGIALDAVGNIYVAEASPGDGAAGDAHLVLKLDAAGGVIWTRTFTANPLFAESSAGLSFNAGFLAYAGSETDPGTGAVTGQLWRLDPAGNIVWMTPQGGSPDDENIGVRADAYGRVFGTGRTGDHATPAWDQVTGSLDAAGAGRWGLTYDSGGPRDEGHAVALRSPSEVFVAGVSAGDARLTKYTEPPAAALAALLDVVPLSTAPGQWVRVVLTVTNGGAASVTGLVPALQINAGAVSVTQIGGPSPVPAGPVTIPAGGAQSFTWTFSAAGAGLVGFTATGAGTDAGSGGAIAAAASATLLIGPRAVLIATGRLVPPSTSVYLGQMFSMELTVTNTGGIPALAVMPFLYSLGGSGTMDIFSGPTPAGPLDLGPGGSTTFVWSFTVTGVGPLTTTVFAAGWDGVSATLMAGSRLTTTFYRAGNLDVSIQIQPPVAVTVGVPITVILTVSNTGQVPVTGVMPDLSPDSMASLVTLTGGPVPAGPVNLAGGATQRFTWTYNTVGAGDVEFSATATGFDTGLGGPLLSVTSTGSETIVAASQLGAAWKLSATTVQQGRTFTATFSVTNNGATDAWNVTPAAASASVVIASGWRARQTKGPTPVVRLILGPDETVNFSYTFRATGTGYVDFSATATGQDSATLAALMVPAFSATVFITPGAVLGAAASLTPGTLRVGYPFTFRLTVTNTGSADAVVAIPSLTPAIAGLARLDTGPTPGPGATIYAGGSVTYTWNLTALQAGTLVLTGAVSATDSANSNAAQVTASAAASVVMTPRPDGEIAVYPNPDSTDLLRVFLNLDGDAAHVTLDVYDASMRRVYTGEWRGVTAVDGTLDITGIKGWAPGIYLVRAVATMGNGTTRAFPVVKLKVRR